MCNVLSIINIFPQDLRANLFKREGGNDEDMQVAGQVQDDPIQFGSVTGSLANQA